jgi:Xaa-Pro aminopeptidase
MARDEKKLSRVREAMRHEGLGALVLRVSENVSYLSDAWPDLGGGDEVVQVGDIRTSRQLA